MQYKVLSITSAEIVIESKSGAKHIIEYGKGARPHIDLRKVRVSQPSTYRPSFRRCRIQTSRNQHCGSFRVARCVMHCVPLYCITDCSHILRKRHSGR
jgi:hypothetical protein